ncbi:MAG: threonine synthase [Rhodospirillales bacterium]|nr:threonine synthase [Alphaproteobacteria bacterium]USO04558.1 MAG: threonine synthase [Rhodospirillales bacterium]
MTAYISTRGATAPKSFTDVLLSGLAPDGGLFLPERWPVLEPKTLKSLVGAPYADVACQVMAPFVGKDIPAEDLHRIISDVYRENFNHSAVAPLVQIGPNAWILELFHGPTLAFKDYALQFLGRMFDYVLERRGQRVTIVGATSGDTGSAAIEAFRSCRNIDIFILHPEGRTSDVQRRQMTTIEAPNVFNIALKGTFDDCQGFVKDMFADRPFREEMNLSAVNSINWARIMAQIVYYVSASLSLGGPERKVSFAVPTGNFGNILAAWSAKKMGASIESLIIGSNRNDILTRFFETGTMQAGTVEPSLSPSMDIQISSNFERYLCECLGRDHERLKALMESFKQSGRFSVSADLLARAKRDFAAHRCSDEQTREMIGACYKETGYLIDPHTAVGLFAGWQEEKRDPAVPLVALACAHPAKFPDAVKDATGVYPELPEHLSDLYERKEHFTVLEKDFAKVQDFVKTNANR